MPGARKTVERGWAYRGFEAVILENDRLRASVLPELGAKVHQFIDKKLDRDLLYHHPRVEVRAPVFGANVDNWWTGGIDDAVPTAHPCVVDGEELPFLGEAWSMPWEVGQVTATSIHLSRAGVIWPFRLEKVLSLRPGDRYLTAEYTLTNTGLADMPFLWGIHPALPVGPRTRIHVPAMTAWYGSGTDPQEVLPASFRSGKQSLPWPVEPIASLPAEPAGAWHHLFLDGLDDGWLAVTDEAEGWGFGVQFPATVFRAVHIWAVDGGWRGIRTVVVEPWTGRPARLDEAITQGFARTLRPRESLTAAVRFVAFDARGRVSGFTAKGEPR